VLSHPGLLLSRGAQRSSCDTIRERRMMTEQSSELNASLFLRAGDRVQVRSLPEILSTLDPDGKLHGLPFMPEMIQFCGKKFRVAKRAEQTCFGGRPFRMGNAVHLAGLRCDGSAHDGCQSACFLFWREEWLKRVCDPGDVRAGLSSTRYRPNDSHAESKLVTRTVLQDGGVTYVCQATELGKTTEGRLKFWELGQYYREIRAGNVGWSEVKHFCRWLLTWIRWRIFKYMSNEQNTPAVERQKISPGDFVEIRPTREILRSLRKDGTHLGLAFSAEMLTFCGRQYRVLNRVTRMIDEETGRMKVLKNNCLILDSVTCGGHCTLCPRANFHFWRDEWLRRVQ
jgi:hypothetical protein